MEREDLIGLVTIIMNGGIDKNTNTHYSEIEVDRMVDAFEKNIPCEFGSDLIFYPNLCGLPDNMSAEQIVDFALNYKKQ